MKVDDLREGDEIVLPEGQRFAGDVVTVSRVCSRGALTNVLRIDRPVVQHITVILPNDADIDLSGVPT